MLNCEYCDYFAKTHGASRGNDGRSGERCEFTSYMFTAGELTDAGEYPCRNTCYQDYLRVKIKKDDLSEAV